MRAESSNPELQGDLPLLYERVVFPSTGVRWTASQLPGHLRGTKSKHVLTTAWRQTEAGWNEGGVPGTLCRFIPSGQGNVIAYGVMRVEIVPSGPGLGRASPAPYIVDGTLVEAVAQVAHDIERWASLASSRARDAARAVVQDPVKATVELMALADAVIDVMSFRRGALEAKTLSEVVPLLRRAMVIQTARSGGKPFVVAMTGAEVGAEFDFNSADGVAGTPTLDELGQDLTKMAREGQLPTTVGRDREVDEVFEILLRRTKGNPVLLGPAGSGKTSIVNAVAQRLVRDDAPAPLRNMRIVALEVNSLVAGTKYRGEFEQKLQAVIAEAVASKTIIFVDELHTLIGAGATSGHPSGGDQAFKPALADGSLRMIGATTDDEYARYVKKDPALDRRFEPVRITAMSAPEAAQLVRAMSPELAAHHGVVIAPGVPDEIIKLTERRMLDRSFPDKAMDVLDRTCARVRLASLGGGSSEVGVDEVRTTVAMMTGVPIAQLTANLGAHLAAVDVTLAQRIVGQPHALAIVSDMLLRAYAGLRDPERPTASFLFTGPPGVGKTELARVLASDVLEDASALVRLDMSEFKDSHQVTGLIGSAPGYKDSDRGGRLTEAVARAPRSVVLFDEIEKAHPSVLDILLQLLDVGHLTDGTGKRVDFRNTIVVLTTNLGADEAMAAWRADLSAEETATRVRQALSSRLRPELIDRLNAVVPFRPLGGSALGAIVELTLKRLADRVIAMDVELTWTPAAVAMLAALQPDGAPGARAIHRIIEQQVESVLARSMVTEGPGPAQLDVGANGELTLRRPS